MFKKVMNKKGFTLIELIVVMAILAILAAVAIPRFTGTQSKANERAHQANKATLQSAAEVCVAENGAPTSKVEWTALSSGTGDFAANKYLSTWPDNPMGTGGYTVTIETNGEIEVTP